MIYLIKIKENSNESTYSVPYIFSEQKKFRMKTLKFYLPLFILLLSGFSGYAQKDLKINEVFETIGKEKGTLIQLGPDVLSLRTNITVYKSLQIKADASILEKVEKALAEDTMGAEGIFFSDKKDGSKIRHYGLKKNTSASNEYILFQLSKGYISLVYLKGNFPSKDLKKELDKLKDLFIELKK